MQPNYRRCVSCRKVANRQHLLRIVRTHPTGAVQFDHGMGRSAYLCPQPSCLHLAQKKNRLGRALKVAIPDTIYRLLHQKIS
ncbi:MAG: YlxR family protein [Cyanobacteria bacterium P01_H01_bin.26]